MIQAGELRQRITIQEATDAQANDGQVISTWSVLKGNVPAKVESVTGGEEIRGRQVAAESTTLFTIRWMSGLNSRIRVRYESRTLYAVRVSDPYGDRRELRIECKESD